MRAVLYTYLIPALFVWLWSTGFIGAKFGLPYAEPFTLLLIRMLFTLVLLGLLVWWLKPRWPDRRSAVHLAITGLLVHGCYLGGVYYAILGGMPSGIVSLIVGLQPLLTGVAAVFFLREGISVRQWTGLLLGLLGVSLVIVEKLGPISNSVEAFPLWTLAWAALSLVGISLGTVYQKRYGAHADLVPGTMIQYAAAAVFFSLGSFGWETREVEWALPLQLSMAWLVLGVSIGAILLLMWLIRRGAANQVASLFYLVPPVTAIQAYWAFDETLGTLAMFGGVLSITGVALVVTRTARAAGD